VYVANIDFSGNSMGDCIDDYYHPLTGLLGNACGCEATPWCIEPCLKHLGLQ
jgi:hypothetical protein